MQKLIKDIQLLNEDGEMMTRDVRLADGKIAEIGERLEVGPRAWNCGFAAATRRRRFGPKRVPIISMLQERASEFGFVRAICNRI